MRSSTFINIGPGRCATSWLYDLLVAHPDVQMAAVKETEFFNTNYAKGIRWYERHFPDGPQKAVGEISNNYYLDAGVALRIFEYNPAMRVIVNVRKPVDLLRSFYQFGVRRGIAMSDLAGVLGQPIGPIMGSGYHFRESRGGLTCSDRATLFEAVQLEQRMKPFFDVFPAEQIYVLVYERVREEPVKLLEELYEFIGVDPSFSPPKASDVVNAALTPKSQAIAKIATRISFLLRRFGMYRVLNNLKQSKLVKQLLYSDRLASAQEADLLATLPESLKLQLSAEEAAVVRLCPALQRYWGSGGIVVKPADTSASGVRPL